MKPILMEELQVSFYVPAGLDADEYEAIRRVLTRKRFLTQLRRIIRALVRRHKPLMKVRVTVSR